MSPSGNRSGRGAAGWSTPYVLLFPEEVSATGRRWRSRRAPRLRRRQADVAEHLRVLEAACWRGELGPRELALLQKLRVALVAADRAVDPGDDRDGPA